MATLSSILAWTIAWTEEPGWLLIPGVTKELDTTEHARTGSRSRASRIVASQRSVAVFSAVLAPSALTLAWCFIVSLPTIWLMNWDLAQTGGSALKLMSISLYELPTFFLQLAAPLSSEGVGTGRRD